MKRSHKNRTWPIYGLPFAARYWRCSSCRCSGTMPKMCFRVVPGFKKRYLIATRLESTDSVRTRCPFLSSACPQPFGNWAGNELIDSIGIPKPFGRTAHAPPGHRCRYGTHIACGRQPYPWPYLSRNHGRVGFKEHSEHCLIRTWG